MSLALLIKDCSKSAANTNNRGDKGSPVLPLSYSEILYHAPHSTALRRFQHP
jgi:hypothetical protein